ncbi:MAG: holin family protein [Paracoccaceae bacterium]|nr:MAG: holin family protein [Paracoccaceae bacterium]
MGVIGKILGGPAAIAATAEAAKGIAEVFTPNATRRMELGAEAQSAALRQFGVEFTNAPAGWFDRFVNGLNRLPRPMLAFGTMGLFVYAMADPAGFGARMVGLNAVPEPLWWLLAAVVGFYFGAREAHYFRMRPVAAPAAAAPEVPEPGNPALDDWRQARG